MQITKEMLQKEIKVLQKAAKLHAKYSILQYKHVLKTLDALESEKALLEKKVKLRTSHLEKEIAQKEIFANQLEKIAKYDQLTGLANRYLFLSELELIHQEAILLKKTFALLFIDLDGFKLINDTYGHDIGDYLLQIIAKRIESVIRADDLVARLGGDEFTIILRNISSKKKLQEITELLIKEIQKVIHIHDLEIYTGSSIGIYMFGKEDKHTFSDIISMADIAMYESKKAGKGIYTFFDDSMQKELHRITTMKHQIKSALQEKKFINYFQPIVSSKDHTIKGAEILLRWFNGRELISPTIFIPILEEEISLIKEVTFWQIEEIIKILPKNDLYYAINISAKLLNMELLEELKRLKKKYNFKSSRIHFEVTETSLSTNLMQASEVLAEIKDMGFYLSLDDFGTGYSSLAYLRELSFDTLKIDKKFIDDAFKSAKNKKLLFAIMNMAKILEMKIVLEGIEESYQLEIVEEASYVKLQGFLFYKPMIEKEFLKITSASPKRK